MLKTSEERIKLLKAGYTGKMIEQLYIKYNNFKIISASILRVEEADNPKIKKTHIRSEIAIDFAQYVCAESA
ncbi:MAG TPA: hypothetical protein VJJ51_01925 [Candidatus Methanoperedens sp.]|nr:hypothetical protein [Candidatus Methanoperedens sp.]HLB69781.1 hypothetical protein [Candidatus Methanoperedens sp.]